MLETTKKCYFPLNDCQRRCSIRFIIVYCKIFIVNEHGDTWERRMGERDGREMIGSLVYF